MLKPKHDERPIYSAIWKRQFNALFRKSAIIFWKRPSALFTALLAPALGVALITLLYSQTDGNEIVSSVEDSITYEYKVVNSCNTGRCTLFRYVPNDAPHNAIMQNLVNLLPDGVEVRGFPTVELMARNIYDGDGWMDDSNLEYSAAFVFHDGANGTETSYSYMPLRREFTQAQADVALRDSSDDRHEGKISMKGVQQGSLSIAMDSAITAARLGSSQPLVKVNLKPFPADELLPSRVDKNDRSATTSTWFKCIMAVGFIPLMTLGLSAVNKEEVDHSILPLRKMGLIESTYWLSTYSILLLINTIAASISTVTALICANIYPLWAHIDLWVFFLIQFISGAAFAGYGLFLASFFRRPVLLYTAVGLIVTAALAFEWISPLLSSIEMGVPIEYFVGSEYYALCALGGPWFQYGKLWSDIFVRVVGSNAFKPLPDAPADYAFWHISAPFQIDDPKGPYIWPTAWTLGFQALHCIAYLLIAWWAMQVFGSSSRRPYFFLQHSYWRGQSSPASTADQQRPKSATKAGLTVKNITKKFKTATAVDNVSFDINRGTLCAMLGHNGAGKTTMMNMLSGSLRPSSGSASFGEHDIFKEQNRFQNQLGMCAQDDLLYGNLSAADHVRIYALFRGIQSNKHLDSFVEERLQKVGLAKQGNKPVSGFSGGMKRRLSVALAFVGNVKVVFLDEPSTGMDPINRRAVWRFIKEQKKDKVVILTTHSLEEAELLGDHIAIMHKSTLKAFGTASALKRAHGKGYILDIVCHADVVNIVANMIAQSVPESEILAISAGTLTASIPRDKMSSLTCFFRQLTRLSREEKKKMEWSFKDTTLETVFLQLGALNGDHNDQADVRNRVSGVCHQCGRHVIETSAALAESSKIVCDECSAPTSSAASGPQVVGNAKQGVDDAQITVARQTNAVFRKSVTKQWRQKKDNICIVLMVLIVLSLVAWAQIELASMMGPRSVTCGSGVVSTARGQNATLKPTCNVEMLRNQFIDAASRPPPDNETATEMLQTFTGNSSIWYQDESEKPSFSDWYTNQSLPLIPTNIEESFMKGVRAISQKVYSTQAEAEVAFRTTFPRSALFIHTANTTSALLDFDVYLYSDAANYSQVRYSEPNAIRNFGPKAEPWKDSAQIAPIISRQFAKLSGAGSIFSKDEEVQFMTFDTTIASCVGVSIFAILMTTSLAFPSFISTPVEERESGVMHLTQLQGLRPFAFWLGTYLFDFVFGLLLLIVSIGAGLSTGVLRGDGNLLLVSGLLWVHVQIGAAIFISSLLSSSQTSRTIGLFLALVIPFLASMSSGEGFGYMAVPKMIFPPFAFAECLKQIAVGRSFDAVYIPWVMLFATGTALSAFGMMNNLRRAGFISLRKNRGKEFDGRSKEIDLESAELDDDVFAERRRVLGLPNNSMDAMIIKRLRKSYGDNNVVDDLCLGMQYGECFALLGPNGAGKTTTMKMIMNLVKPDSGSIRVDGKLSTDPDICKVLGVCPQFDCPYPDLTVSENLRFYARIRGAPKATIDDWVLRAAQIVSLDGGSFRKPVAQLSGGMRRRLSISIALIGLPPIIMLDEPTTGLDVANRRAIWDIIAKLKEKGDHLILLTTHSMEEADALADRIGIQAGGNLRCLGNQVHLKRKFGSGDLIMKITFRCQLHGALLVGQEQALEETLTRQEETAIRSVDRFLRTLLNGDRILPGARSTLDAHRDIAHDPITGRSTWRAAASFILRENFEIVAKVLAGLQSQKDELRIVDWSIEQTTLEEVFLKIAGPYVKDET